MKICMIFLIALIVPMLPPLAERCSAESHPVLRRSWYIAAGGGWGNGHAELTVVEKIDRQNGVIGFFRFGRAIKDKFAIGIESSIWEKIVQDRNIKWNLTTIAVTGTYFVKGSGIYARAGAGLGYSSFERDQSNNGNEVEQDRAGLEILGALGYEYRLLPNLALGPQADFKYIDIGGNISTKADLFALSAQVTWYW
jgi:hypothetical protein